MVIYVDFLTGCKNTLFSFFLSRTCVIFNKFATEKSKSETAMKRNTLRTILAACMASALILSCGPMEPSEYTENFYRIASVNYVEGKASLKFDYTGEKYSLDNFQTKADMNRFDLKHGDRIIAGMQYHAISTVGKISLMSVAQYPILKLEESRPADTLNHDCRFNVLTLWDVQYPAIWAQGHLVNMAPIYYIPNGNCTVQFKLYPLQMNRDTLEMRLYSYIPENDLSIHGYSDASQTWICFDISSITDSVADPDEFNHRKQILNEISQLKGDSMMVHIFQPDTLRGMLDTIYYERYPKVSVSIKIPRDF